MALLEDLLDAPSKSQADRIPQNFEEVKLILALAWQRGRWDGSDGGRGGYGQVLAAMAEAVRYESEDEKENSISFVQDMLSRFHLLAPTADEQGLMQTAADSVASDFDASRRQCSALVLQAMGFVENGL